MVISKKKIFGNIDKVKNNFWLTLASMYHFFNSVFIRFTGMYQAKIKRKENEKKNMKRNVIIGKKK